MQIIAEHDVLIIGGGAAGIRAAIAAAEQEPGLSIALISKVYPTRSHTVSAEGGIAAAMKKGDSVRSHAKDTIKGSDYLADQDAVEFFVKRCKEEILTLEQWGCPWSREKNGSIAVRAFGGMSNKRTVFAADKTGFFMLHNMFERSTMYRNIHRYDEWYVTELTTNSRGTTGCIAIQNKTGKIVGFSAKAIIMATGGAGKMYGHTTNGAIKTGDGMALALNAGAALKDMEFIQFHPTALPSNGVLITEACRGEGGYLLNNKNERFLKHYLPDAMELGPRDLISKAIHEEYKKGHGFKGPYGNYIHLDIRHLGEEIINRKLPQIREMAKEYMGVDPIKEPIPVTPAQHYTMGGISTSIQGETTVKGLFAAGETACVTINGANRLGSNSLAECLVFGAETGKSAAKFAKQKKAHPRLSHTELEKSAKKISKLMYRKPKNSNKSENENPYKIREQLGQIMDKHAGIVRTEKELTSGLKKVRDLKKQIKKVSITQKNAIFNNDLIATLELKAMLTIAETVLLSAIERKESRGAHFRKDYPVRDDKNHLHHNLMVLSTKGTRRSLKAKTAPVTITKWQPKERKY